MRALNATRGREWRSITAQDMLRRCRGTRNEIRAVESLRNDQGKTTPPIRGDDVRTGRQAPGPQRWNPAESRLRLPSAKAQLAHNVTLSGSGLGKGVPTPEASRSGILEAAEMSPHWGSAAVMSFILQTWLLREVGIMELRLDWGPSCLRKRIGSHADLKPVSAKTNSPMGPEGVIAGGVDYQRDTITTDFVIGTKTCSEWMIAG